MALINVNAQNYYTGNNAQSQNYQFISLVDIINQFMIGYVGEDKIVSKVKRSDVGFFAQRAMQEFSFDTFKSCKTMEIELPASLQMTIPQDYVNWTKISWSDGSGIKHRLYPTTCKTGNPFRPQQDEDGDLVFDAYGNLIESGELLNNTILQGAAGTGSVQDSWLLNKDIELPPVPAPIQPVSNAADTTADPITNSIGWFHTTTSGRHLGQNKIIGYNLPDKQGFNMRNLPILSGEKYIITFTLSGYSSGTYEWLMVDDNQNYKYGAQVNANGTYTQEFDLSTGITRTNTFPTRSIGFRQTGSTAGNVTIDNISLVRVGYGNESTTWGNYKSSTPSENNNDDYENETYWKLNGERYGLDPQHAQANGSFFVDCDSGKIHFSSNVSGKTIVLDYLSDGLGTAEEMRVHKFAEEAMYKHIAYSILSNSVSGQNLVPRFKKERFAETRKAKLRLSNIKIEEITQILRGKSKWIKH